jgi:hypothetical protein
MDAAVAGILGAAVGLTGVIAASVINSGRARTLRREERQEEAYANGVRAMSKLFFAAEEDRSLEDLLTAHGHIQIVGAPDTAEEYRKVTFELHKWLEDNDYSIDMTSWNAFQRLARRDVRAVPRRWRYVIRSSWRASARRLKAYYRFPPAEIEEEDTNR